MAEVKSLEDRIREKAVNAYAETVAANADVFFKSLGFNTYHEWNLGERPREGHDFRMLNTNSLKNEIIKQAVRARSQQVGDEAVKAFLEKVETLQDEVDEIRDIINA
jgi:hypothetical protein